MQSKLIGAGHDLFRGSLKEIPDISLIWRVISNSGVKD